MTQDHTNGDGVPTTALPTDAEILQKWYAYASRLPGSVGSLLQLLRFRLHKSEEQQRLEFEVSATDFAKLQSMRAPRPDYFHSDARRIAGTCRVGRISDFVNMLMLARNLADHQQAGEEGEVYEAAFDAPVSEQDGTEE